MNLPSDSPIQTKPIDVARAFGATEPPLAAQTPIGMTGGEQADALQVRESAFRRWIFGLCLFVVAGLYAFGLACSWNPAHPGVDQNGYLVGGKLLATTGTTGFIPENMYSFVGAMWNLGPDGKTFYVKYPIGLPAIYALMIKLFGMNWGVYLSHAVSPACATLALVGTYLLARPYVGGFGAVLAALVVGVSPLTWSLAVNPNSHASTMAFVVFGMAMLLSWWRSGGWWRAGLAGFLLGYAVTIRYTEGLLLLPMGFVFLDRWFRRQKGAYWQGLVMAAGWALPVGILLWFNLLHFGTPTGYDSTRESTGFGWQYFVANWDLMLRDMNDKALVLIFPLGLAGMGLMAASGKGGWKLGAILALWVFPCLLTYTAYYWAPDGASIGYSRFFLTVLPGVVLGAVWVLVRAGHTSLWYRRWGAALVGGAVITLATATASSQDAEVVIPDTRQNLLVDLVSESVLRDAPSGSVIFADPRLMHHLQFVGDYALYQTEVFSRQYIQRLGQMADVDDPNPHEPFRASVLYSKLKDKSDADMIAEQNRLMDQALAVGKRVFLVGTTAQVSQASSRFLRAPGKYSTKVVEHWGEPADYRRNRWQRTDKAPPPWVGRRANLNAPASRQMMWQVLEVTKGPGVPPPAPKPAAAQPPTATRPVPPASRPAVQQQRENRAAMRRAAATTRSVAP